MTIRRPCHGIISAGRGFRIPRGVFIPFSKWMSLCSSPVWCYLFTVWIRTAQSEAAERSRDPRPEPPAGRWEKGAWPMSRTEASILGVRWGVRSRLFTRAWAGRSLPTPPSLRLGSRVSTHGAITESSGSQLGKVVSPQWTCGNVRRQLWLSDGGRC